MQATTVYWEDVDEGAVWEGGAFVFDTEAITRFAREFDPRPTHLDAAAAAASFFGGLCASGAHTFAAWARLYWELTPGWANQAGAEITRMRLPRPVFPDDVLSLRFQVTGKRPSPIKPAAGFLDQTHTVRNQDGRPVLRMDCRVMIDRRPREALAGV